MPSARSLTLCTIAAIVLAGSGMMTFAQPASDPPAPPKGDAPAPAPRGQPGADGQRPEGPRAGQPGEGRGGQRGGEGGVRQGMSTMNRALRTLTAQISDATKKDENLKLINDLERGCVSAKGAVPDKALGRMEEAKRAEAAVMYRRQLIAIMEKALKVETALMDGKTADAAKLVEEIAALRDESHKAMGVKDDDR